MNLQSVDSCTYTRRNVGNKKIPAGSKAGILSVLMYFARFIGVT